jgi:hypothetical protein
MFLSDQYSSLPYKGMECRQKSFTRLARVVIFTAAIKVVSRSDEKKINIYFEVTKLKEKVKTWQQLDTKLDRFDNVLSYNDVIWALGVE